MNYQINPNNAIDIQNYYLDLKLPKPVKDLDLDYSSHGICPYKSTKSNTVFIAQEADGLYLVQKLKFDGMRYALE